MERYLLAWFYLGLQLTFSPSLATADHHYRLVPLIPAAVFAPAGFDDNDNAQVVIDGIFPDSCHSNGPLETKVDLESKEIRIQNTSIVTAGKCQMMLGSYTRVVDLGPLPIGQYKLVFIDPTNHLIEKGTLSIKRAATPSSDEFF
ncbi:MAG: hypothetical protein K2X47_17500, partial [Bdellovibrionales bacterium]|nr:hypothetical protein [Bdellovibrionales bacterium]